MKNIVLITAALLLFCSCNSSDKGQKRASSSPQQDPVTTDGLTIEQRLFYKNGDYKPVMITLNENYNDSKGAYYLYFIKVELGKQGVHLTYIYNNSENGAETKILRQISRDEYIKLMKKVLATKILDLTGYETEDPAESHMMRDMNIFEFNLEFQVLRFYYTLDELGSADFWQQKKIIDVIKNTDTYLGLN